MRTSLLMAALVIATPASAVEVFPLGSGQYEIVQETGFSYSDDARAADATRFCKKRGRQMQVIADLDSLRFSCVRR
jgi:hypothetical protein